MRLYLLGITLLLSKISFCCSCVPLNEIDEQQYNQYSLIFKGKIIKVYEASLQRIILVKVDTYYKGEQKTRTIKITTPRQSGECGIFPKTGESWLMFAYVSRKEFMTNLCTRTKNMNPKSWNYNNVVLTEDLEFLERKLKKTAANNALPKVRARHWNIGYKSLSAVVRAGRFQFCFCS